MKLLKKELPQAMLWFGASISIAEILSGGLLAPLGLSKGIMAILLGHLIGAVLMFGAAIIGGMSRMPSIKSSRISFGKYGSYFFSIMNILQLIGWTAVMMITGATAVSGITNELFGIKSYYVAIIVIMIIILVYIKLKSEVFKKVNSYVVGLLLLLTVILAFTVFKDTSTLVSSTGDMSFSLGVELSVIMCLSWLPLIGDYTCKSEHPVTSSLVSVVAYFIGSSFMYIVGLGAVLYVNTSDISVVLLASGLGLIALVIAVLSTVTTTYLDIYSAGESMINITKKYSMELILIVVTVIGTVIALFFDILHYESFLILIGSVFAPMISIMIADYILLRKREINRQIDIEIIPVFILGVILYNQFITIETVIGSSVPVMIIIVLVTIIVRKIMEKVRGLLCIKR